MEKKELFERVISYFQKEMPVAETELIYQTPYELLVAVILSAQCTDKRVNQITPDLLRRFPTPDKMAEAEPAKYSIIFVHVPIPTTSRNIWLEWPEC